MSSQEINRVPLMIVLISGAFVAILNQTLLATALPHIMADLQLDANTAQWLQSIFMLVNGIMIPITAFLIERFTTRGLFMTAVGLFAAGTLVCGLAPNFPILLAGRVLQASGAGIILPLMQTILFLVFPIEKRGSAMGMFGLVIAFAPAIGPTLSGWLVEQFPWRSLFFVILPIAIADIIVAYFILKNVTKQTFPKVDPISIILSTFGFGGILYGFSVAGSASFFSNEVLISLAVGAVTLTLFITRQMKLENPILEFRIFKYKIFTLTTILGMIVFISMIGGAVILPILMQDMLGFTAFESGLMLLPGALLMGIMNPITGRLFDRFGARWLAVIGLGLLVISTFMFTTLGPSTTFLYLALVNCVRMFGISMVMMPVTTAGLNQLPQHLMPHGTAMNNTMRQVSGAVGTAMLVSVMTSQTIPDEGVKGLIHGVNISFVVAGIFAVVGFVMAFFINKSRPDEGELSNA
ncbi:drug resistance transporter, EmrB/QacA subfamily [Halobacillus karajensis]|uniref:Multidrug resistance protein B n=1 Tax=Halobacillus karajensis TaxID=195088 RepID=A0A059NYQ6_9BACI|nr:DHA2 family efflux MFS transporter permease subunit [Halobacillus karajensis]CDQ18557.1 Multidrug resistance protein B [Halobacillus karajensis]CDQ23371.1 Multidrug resistance protein B [Halobacillus karajensis]CDQ26853.1 Multidrug resistance protein B [Halobacillus karajensis]SEH49950.1 drug resistance transporter, EmrB/QacA subfamily [Halobacillus karajensis]